MAWAVDATPASMSPAIAAAIAALGIARSSLVCFRKSIFASQEWRAFALEVKAQPPLTSPGRQSGPSPEEMAAPYRHINQAVPAASVMIVSGAPTLK
jgi:hypothetical protein